MRNIRIKTNLLKKSKIVPAVFLKRDANMLVRLNKDIVDGCRLCSCFAAIE